MKAGNAVKEGWSKRPIKIENKISFVFSWDLWSFIERGPTLEEMIIGGPAVKANPAWIPPWVQIGRDEPFLHYHNSLATRTSIGCIRKCEFCIVPRIEGKLRELNDWSILPIVIDNNLLACSRKHFDKVIDSLKSLEWCDFNQGLDARLLTQHHVDRFTELKKPMIRLAFDDIKYEKTYLEAIAKIFKSGIPKSRVKTYVLIGFNDTPEDALYRLELIRGLGMRSNPMRFQPINVKYKNEYVSSNWINKELIRYMTYWSRQIYLSKIPFKDFECHKSAV